MPQSKINKVQEDIEEEGDRFHFRSTDEDDLLVGSKKRVRSKDDIGMEIHESTNKVKYCSLRFLSKTNCWVAMEVLQPKVQRMALILQKRLMTLVCCPTVVRS